MTEKDDKKMPQKTKSNRKGIPPKLRNNKNRINRTHLNSMSQQHSSWHSQMRINGAHTFYENDNENDNENEGLPPGWQFSFSLLLKKLERICENLLTLHFYGGKENRSFSFSISFTLHFSLLTPHFLLLTPSKKRLGAQAMCLRSEERVYEV